MDWFLCPRGEENSKERGVGIQNTIQGDATRIHHFPQPISIGNSKGECMFQSCQLSTDRTMEMSLLRIGNKLAHGMFENRVKQNGDYGYRKTIAIGVLPHGEADDMCITYTKTISTTTPRMLQCFYASLIACCTLATYQVTTLSRTIQIYELTWVLYTYKLQASLSLISECETLFTIPEVIFQFYNNFFSNQGLEKRVEQLEKMVTSISLHRYCKRTTKYERKYVCSTLTILKSFQKIKMAAKTADQLLTQGVLWDTTGENMGHIHVVLTCAS